MNILIVTTEIGYDGGGMSLSCLRLKDILSSEHTVSSFLSTHYPITTAGGGLNPSTERSIQKEYKLKEDVRKYADTDVVIGFGGRFNGYYASLLAERLEARFILSLRGSDINITKWSVNDSWYTIEACRRASKIICLSKEMVENVISLIPSANGKILIIPNEMIADSKPISFPNLPKKVVLGCAASHLNEKKGIANLLYMLSEFKLKSNIPVFLDLVGDVDWDLRANYDSIINEIGLTSNVIFRGYKSREELNIIMSDWDFYIQASVCEGHPNSVSESLIQGHAFISTNTGFIAELLSPGFPLMFFDSFEPNRMAENLIKLISEHNLEGIYQKARELLMKECNEERISEKWHKLLSYNPVGFKNLCVENILAIGLHDIFGEVHDSITTPKMFFEQFVDFIYSSGYGLCSMKDYIKKPKEVQTHYIVCTFDDGYKSLVSTALPILAKYNFTATVYVCTSLIGKDNSWNNKDAVHRLHLDRSDIMVLNKAGWEIASHGVSHRNLLKLSDVDIEYELSESKRILSEMVGDVCSYAYPYGAYNKFTKYFVEKYYKYAFAVSQGGNSLLVDKLQLRRYSITDIYKMLSPEK